MEVAAPTSSSSILAWSDFGSCYYCTFSSGCSAFPAPNGLSSASFDQWASPTEYNLQDFFDPE
jgi:hypothetical protein